MECPKNTLNASYLTFADGARFSFDLSNPDTKSNTMLTINGAPNFGGKVYFDFGSGEVGEKYNLIYFGSSVNSNCLENFVSYKGTLDLVNNYLTLTYAAEQSATWNGSSGTWTASTTNWMDAASPEKSVVNFTSNTETQTVTVSGTVNPSEINVTGGSYVFESDATTPGSISGSRDLTVSGGASLESRMSLGEHAVVVKESSSFTYNVDSTGSIDVSDLRLTDSTSKATFKGNATYDVWQSTLSGSISVLEDANLVLHSDADVASVTLAEQLGADAQLSFRNSSNSGMVQYTLSTSPTSGTVKVGSEKDTFGTRLNVTSADTTYTVAKDSILAISDSGTSNFKASGEGTVLVDSGKTVTLAVSQSAEADGTLLQGTLSDVNFEVAKTATATLESVDKNMRFEKTITVNGTLEHKHTYSSTNSTVEINNLKLDSGIYKFTGGGQYCTIVNQVDNLEVRGSGTIYTNYTSSSSTISYYPKFEMRICKLSGDGNINFLREKTNASSDWGHKGIVQIDKLDDFAGSIKLTAGLSTTFESIGTIQNLVLGGGNMTGEIEVAFERGSGDWLNKANLVFSGDTTIGGLKSTALGANTQYSANYNQMRLAGGTCSIDDPSTITTPTDGTRYTLTVKTQASSDDYTFTGHVGEGLNLAKHGEGKQSFVGDLSKFNGDVEVKGGTLVMTSSRADRVSPDDSANEAILNVKRLGITGGAKLQAVLKNISDSGADSALKIVVSGAFEARAYVSDLVGAAEAATFALDDAVGTTATENPVATINAALDLSSAESLTFETGVDLGDQALTLGSKKALTLSRSMGVSQGDGTYNVTLFKNVGSVAGLSSDPVDADTLFTSDNLTSSSTLVYDSAAKTIVLTNVTFDTPEPTTATLALLGLMGLCARRRRQK
ncbi:MAG: PEP-CTERM sorting domain-containing protein [Akkermansia sp.]